MFAVLVSWAVRLLAFTWRVEQAPWPVEGPCVVALWHGDQLAHIALHRRVGMTGMVSRSRDGERLAAVLAALGYPVVRGSTSNGGTEALFAAGGVLRAGGRPAIAVDGPRGPAGRVQPGAELLAARHRVPVVWGVIEAQPRWRARSWDRFSVPLPFARVRITYGVWRRGEGALQDAMLPPR